MHASSLAVLYAARRGLRLAAACLGLLFASSIATPAMADPPGRVGRLGDLQGQVWMFSPESGEWVTAQRNRPVTTADRVATDRGARAEIQVGSTTLRLDGSTELEVLQLDDDTMRYQLHNGSVAARLRTREAAREFELHTAEGRFRPESAGRFRFDRIDETSHVTAWRGQVLFEGPDTAVTVLSGQRAEVWKDSHTQYTLTSPARDAFADWVSARDQADERSASTRYVSPEMTGVEDLDRNGRWEQNPEYGPLWIPYAVAPGWAPYRYGHWTYVRPWGWTWVDDARWGFAPFHYGRWVWHRSVWCWAPGSYVARPVYAPALVAWVGGPRASFSISVGSGPSVCWFPLGPREVYVPGYRVSSGYVRNVNVTHVTNITNVNNIINNPETVVQRTPYVNRGPHAVTVVPSSVMMNRQPVSQAVVRAVDPSFARQLTSAPVQARAPVTAPPEPPRIDVNRGVPRERVRPPGAAAADAVRAPDHGFGRSRIPGSSTPLAAPTAPSPAATPPAPGTPPATGTTPPAAAAMAAPPGRVWRGDEHVGNAPPRVRRGPESQPMTNAPAGAVPTMPAPAITPPSPVSRVAIPPAAVAVPPVAALPPPSRVATPPPPAQPAALPAAAVPSPSARPAAPPPTEGRHPAPPQTRQEQIRPFVSARPLAQPHPAPPQPANPAPANVQRATPAAPAAQGRERRGDQPETKSEREERRDDRGRRG